jgi:predicted nucleic acid-binding protein
MNYLLDTCVISELAKKQGKASVVNWVQQQDHTTLYISSLTLGEIQKGVSKLPSSPKKDDLQIWLEKDVRERFTGKIIGVTVSEALQWGKLQAAAEMLGKPLPLIDSMIAATAIVQDMVLVTRNTKDVEASGVNLLNPWL